VYKCIVCGWVGFDLEKMAKALKVEL